MKKALSVILAVSMVSSMLVGCGNTAETNTEKTAKEETAKGDTAEEQVLKVAAFEGGYGADMWAEVCKAFEASHEGVKIELQIDKKIEDVISPSMKAGEYPDVIHLATGREAALTETLTKENGLEPLTDVLDMTVPGEDVKVKDKIVPGFVDTLATNPYGDGVTYYAPMFYSPCGLFYNAGLLKEKGWEVPTTWDGMWELGEKAKAEGIALFTYPTTGYFDAFMFALISSAGGSETFDKAMSYDDGIWESADLTKVFDICGKLAAFTESTTVANANDQNFTKNQQLILDNKAIFCPNGTWLPGEMKDAPRADGFEWGFTALPAVNNGGAGSSFCWFEQMWIPAAAENKDMAKEFIAYMYSDEAAAIFAKSNAVQPIAGVSENLEGDNKMFYSVYDNGATAVMGGFQATAPVEGVSMKDTLFGTVDSVVSGDKTVADWQKAVEEVSDKLRDAVQ
ncbi:carbohydrate ABC transporter substrate-binding protein [Anaerobium acetethylicum]|uniref:N-acetylglucosamine transport system substrate-binding protein n=1 Tax=Anaerobium acetethylicum TaxID=1619234 RepID=A0A1D3TQ02_9FIRM|nr:carbohydrate ABC transporter substrate-binding protein [Anaerobium acetethylicum]SCP95489.1 N-acetylglucosamine transport system substrate-binding protein [Anaerobium acetethylicum]